MKPLFIAGCVITTIFLDLSFASDWWLRHRGRLVPNTTVGEKVFSGLSIVFAIIGTVGLIMLSIFDTANHQRLHNIFLSLFIGGYLISAIFICLEYRRLRRSRFPPFPLPFLFSPLRYYTLDISPDWSTRPPRTQDPSHLLPHKARLRPPRTRPHHLLRRLLAHQEA